MQALGTKSYHPRDRFLDFKRLVARVVVPCGGNTMLDIGWHTDLRVAPRDLQFSVVLSSSGLLNNWSMIWPFHCVHVCVAHVTGRDPSRVSLLRSVLVVHEGDH